MIAPPAFKKKMSYDERQLEAIKLAKLLLLRGEAGSFHEAVRTASLRYGLDPATFTAKWSSQEVIRRIRNRKLKKSVLEARKVAKSVCRKGSKGLQF